MPNTVTVTRSETIDGRSYTFTAAIPASERLAELKRQRDRSVADLVTLNRSLAELRRRKRGGIRDCKAQIAGKQAELRSVNSEIRALLNR